MGLEYNYATKQLCNFQPLFKLPLLKFMCECIPNEECCKINLTLKTQNTTDNTVYEMST